MFELFPAGPPTLAVDSITRCPLTPVVINATDSRIRTYNPKEAQTCTWKVDYSGRGSGFVATIVIDTLAPSPAGVTTVQVYDGATTASTLLLTATSIVSARTVHGSSAVLLVVLTTDSVVRQYGHGVGFFAETRGSEHWMFNLKYFAAGCLDLTDNIYYARSVALQRDLQAH